MGCLPHVVEDCLGILQVYSDGSICRLCDEQIDFHNFPVKDDGSVVWKDILYNENEKLYLRLYKPTKCTADKQLPIIYFFHGGGFCVGSRTWPNCHNCCLRLSSVLQALVIAPDYRLAPEHRLPAAMDDAFASMKWLQNQALSNSTTYDHDHSWINHDYDRVYVIGDSSGGNMAHHLALRLGLARPNWHRLEYVVTFSWRHFSEEVKGLGRKQRDLRNLFLNMQILDRYVTNQYELLALPI